MARVIPRAEHPISRSKISPNALRVLYKLRDSGFQAFLVGGCVRDLMLGLEPKDFDVATNALPDQVRRIFRNCRLVGRRFRLAHVFFGNETIEVATFRARSAPEVGDEPVDDGDDVDGNIAAPYVAPDSTHPERVFDEHGRLLRDNVYGTVDEDVWRRDFTANALYYDISDFSVWDYTDGAADVMARKLKLIGDPETRYREDPVRMLRAARFEAKLGFMLDPATAAPIPEWLGLLAGVPAARLFDESLKLFLTGHGVASLRVLEQRGLLGALMPNVASYFKKHPGSPVRALTERGLASTDERVVAGKSVTPTFLFAVLLYGPIAAIIEAMPSERWHEATAILDAVERAVRDLQLRVALPRRFALGIRDMFAMQPRLEHPRGRRALRLLESPRFRAAYDLMLLRAQFGMADRAITDWWTRLQAASMPERNQMADALAGVRGPSAARGALNDPGATDATDLSSADGASSSEGPRRRSRGGRRRRRSGSGPSAAPKES